jgi:GT2 family glycosyltransferase
LFDGPSLRLLRSCLDHDSDHFNRTLRVPWNAARRFFHMDRVVDLKGCNYSVSREAMEAINGFDEHYKGYGREDRDVELRLLNMGLSIKSLKGLALQFHARHPRREFTPGNEGGRLQELRASRRVRCARGWREG